MKSSRSKPSVQGEGDYASAKKHNEHARDFAHSGKVDQAAKAAAPRNRNAEEKEAMRQAEAEGRAHAKDPANAQDVGSPDRPPPDKQAPGKHPRGRNPIPEKLPGR